MAFAPHTIREKNQSIQTKLTIGQPNDKYEKEADAVADQVIKMPARDAQGIQRKCENCEEELQMKPVDVGICPVIQRRSDNALSASGPLAGSLSQTRGGGHGLDRRTRAFMNNGFGEDFSKVRIHTDARAIQMNRKLHSRAFTHGQDIYFDRGQYQPGSREGKRLLAHELTHVVQQGKGNLSIQGDWREDMDEYYERAVKRYEEVKERGAEAIEDAERKKDQLYQDGKEYYERAIGYGERKLSEAEELYETGTEKAGELWEEGWKDAEDWWYSGSGDVQKIEFDGSQARVIGSDPYTAPAVSGLMANHPHIPQMGLPVKDYTTPQYQHMADVGPIPEGSYYVNPAEAESNPPATFNVAGWGKYRTRLHERTLTYVKREQLTEREGGFFIHEDANDNGTAGCIGFLNNTDNFEVYKRIKNNSAQIPVEVKYPAAVMAPGTGPAEETG